MSSVPGYCGSSGVSSVVGSALWSNIQSTLVHLKEKKYSFSALLQKMFNTVQKLDLKKFYRCEMLQQKRRKTLLDNMNSKIYYTVNKKFNGPDDFVKRKFFPLMVF